MVHDEQSSAHVGHVPVVRVHSESFRSMAHERPETLPAAENPVRL